MNFYRALPLLLLVTASCADDSRLVETDDCRQISFGLSATSTASRAVESTCDMDLLHDEENSDIDPVKVYVTVTEMTADKGISRGTPVTTVNDLDDFGIYSFYYSSENASAKPFFTNETAVDHSGYWTTDTPYYWPTESGSSLTFWALSSVDAPGVTVTPSSSTPGELEIDYTVPSLASEQRDLMLATTDRLNTPNVRVPLKFSHLCSAVKFVIGKEMPPGIIRQIIVSGIKNQGVYTSTWTNLTGNASFTVNANMATDGNTAQDTNITPDYNTLMMLPQQLADNAMLTVVFHDNVTGLDRNLVASLKGQTWRQGTTTTYHIGISPEFKIEFTQPVDIQDANYVICNSAVRVSGIPADKNWTLTVEASDNSDPSVQLTADVNEYAKAGFWTDKEMINGSTITNVSARGTNTVNGTGSGDFPLTVFLPENTGDANRTVTLTLKIDGTPDRYTATLEITQLHPIWNGNTGWEQIDDNQSGVYGFHYTAKHVYVYNDGVNLTSTADRIINQVKNLIAQYNASGYTEVNRYFQVFSGYRNYVAINYYQLNQLGENAQSTTDGLTNTQQLYRLGGTAVSDNFVKALEAMRRIDDPNTQAYVRRRSTDPNSVPNEIEGSLINESQMLAEILKKNRYYLNTSTVGDLTTTTALIRVEDIVWYIPASGQFSNAPAWYGGTAMNTADFWSSTAGEGQSSYTGNGALTSRNTKKRIRVARNR